MKAIKTKEAIRFLSSHGWAIKRSNGKHDVWGSPDGTQVLALPRHKEVPPGIVRQIRDRLPDIPQSWT